MIAIDSLDCVCVNPHFLQWLRMDRSSSSRAWVWSILVLPKSNQKRIELVTRPGRVQPCIQKLAPFCVWRQNHALVGSRNGHEFGRLQGPHLPGLVSRHWPVGGQRCNWFYGQDGQIVANRTSLSLKNLRRTRSGRRRREISPQLQLYSHWVQWQNCPTLVS